MKIEFEISEEDLLTQQLFATANAESVRKRRGRGRVFLVVIYIVAGVFIWIQSGAIIGGLFLLACIPMYIFYTRMEAKQYQKHIRAFVKEQIRDRESPVTTLHFEKDYVTMADGANVGRIPLSEVKIIYEISQLYSLKLNNGQSIVLPKKHNNNSGNTESMLHHLAERLEIPYVQQLDWKWK